MDDPCLLFLEHHGAELGFERDPEPYSFLQFVGDLGTRFEMEWVRRVAPDAARGLEEDWHVKNVDGLRRTLRLMDEGHDVIHKAALWWAPDQLYGTADYLVRASWLYAKWPKLRPERPERDHYLVMDAKFSRLDSPAKKSDLRVYRTQLRLYSWMLAHLQGYMPRRAFLVTRDRIDDPMPIKTDMTLGQPLPPHLAGLRDQFLHIKLEGGRYRPWLDEIVKPNLGSAKDEPWHNAKKRIADLIPGGPLARLPHIGKSQEEALRSRGITCLDDLLCPDAAHFPFETLPGIGYATAKRIREVLRANRTGIASDVPADLVPPRCEFSGYVDFEFFSDINVDFEHDWPNLRGCQMIFMVGIGWEERGKWQFRRFVAAREDRASERKMFEEFLSFLDGKGVFDPNRSAALYHWSQAEAWQSATTAMRHGLGRLAALPWVDLRQVFVRGSLAIPGSWGLGIKGVVTALGEYAPKYKSPWPADLSSGLAAQVMGWEAYKHLRPLESKEMTLLTDYLEADVRGLWQVLRWLRDESSRTTSAAASIGRGGWYAMARAG